MILSFGPLCPVFLKIVMRLRVLVLVISVRVAGDFHHRLNDFIHGLVVCSVGVRLSRGGVIG